MNEKRTKIYAPNLHDAYLSKHNFYLGVNEKQRTYTFPLCNLHDLARRSIIMNFEL